MTSPNKKKPLLSGFFSIAVLTCLIAGCTSVTDANLDLPEPEPNIETFDRNSDNDPWYNSNGDGMDPIIPRPPNPGT